MYGKVIEGLNAGKLALITVGRLCNLSRHRILKLCRNKGVLKEGRDCLKIYLIRVISRSLIGN
jgi:hypothetical protein